MTIQQAIKSKKLFKRPFHLEWMKIPANNRIEYLVVVNNKREALRGYTLSIEDILADDWEIQK
ncbi:MAG: hypothetical protein WAO19_06635 [Candidatus Kryptoniota bacterium]